MEDITNKDTHKEKEEIQEAISVKTTQEKLVPKFCTNINAGLLKTNNVVLKMAYSEGKDSIAIIETIVMDLEHVKSLNDILTKLLREAENVK